MKMFNKARFQQAYQMAMAEKAPKIYRERIKEKTLQRHLREIADEAQAMYDGQVEFLMEKRQMEPGQADMVATEQVFAEFIQFPQE